jgi:hypothetical protein
MTGVFYLQYAAAFVGGILTLALGLIALRRLLAPPPSNGYVLDINAVRAHAAAAPSQSTGAPSQQRAA